MICQIVRVGVIDESGQPQGWTFQGDRCTPAMAMEHDGVLRYGGYTVAELSALSRGYFLSHFQYRLGAKRG
jgi:hypothetical protein